MIITDDLRNKSDEELKIMIEELRAKRKKGLEIKAKKTRKKKEEIALDNIDIEKIKKLLEK